MKSNNRMGQRPDWPPGLGLAALLMLFFLPGWILAEEKPAEEEKAEPCVPVGINETWKSDDTGMLVDILEEEDREIYAHRANLAALVGPLPGMRVADIGAGSGFMVEELAWLVQGDGKVVAVDINPHMLKLIETRMDELDLGDRVETVQCPEDSVGLPPASIDMAFVCDTYHHFEHPKSSLKSIHEALKPGGQMVVVEFHRIEGVSPEWTFDHVRAGQEVFTREIEEAGFELINVHELPLLERNYVLRFRKR